MRISDWSSDVCSSDLLDEREVDHAFLAFGHAVEHREIAFLDPPFLERALEALVRLGVACEQQAARGVAVEPMHRLRTALEVEGEAFEMDLEADLSVTRRVDGEARRLGEDDGHAIEGEQAVTEQGHDHRSEKDT